MERQQIKYFSLFAGIGGMELGIQQAYEKTKNCGMVNSTRQVDSVSRGQKTEYGSGMGDTHAQQPSDGTDEPIPICVGYSEINKYATQIYQKHFPNHKNYGDITKINAAELPDFDFLCGGFPCQAFSIAGLRRGFDDTRGTLFFDIARILREKQPRLFLLENVKGLLSHDSGRTFKTIVSTLTELGYDLEWQVLNSKDFGVPQNRERIFIVGHLRGKSRHKVFPILESDSENIILPTITTRITADSNGTYVGKRSPHQINNPTHSNDRIYATDGISPTLNTMQGRQRQPKIIARNQRGEIREMDISGSLTNTRSGKQFSCLKIPEATKKGYTEATIGDSINLAVPTSSTRRGRVGKVIAQTLDTGMQQHTLVQGGVRRLTPLECERLQGFPDRWTEGISDSQRYKCLGNAVTVNAIRAVSELLLT